MSVVMVSDAIRYFIEAFFCYMIYENKNICLKKLSNIRKIFAFCALFSLALVAYKCFILDSPTNKFVSTFIIFIYFWVDNWTKKSSSLNKSWSYILTFSVFANLITECSYFIGYIINRYSWQWSGMYETTSTTNLLLYRTTLLTLHFCFMFLIYKVRFIKMKDIKNLSVHVQIPFLFSLCLSTIIYLKYHYKLLGGNPHRDVFMWTLMFLLPTYLGFYQFINKHTVLKNRDKNRTIRECALQTILHPEGRPSKFINGIGGSTPLILLDKYEYLTSGFKKRLNAMNINDSCSGYDALVFCLFVTAMLRGTKGWNFKKDVFDVVEKLFDLPEGEVRQDIEKILKKTWLLEEYETLQNEYYDLCFIRDCHKELSAPSVAEFLTNMARINTMSLKELESYESASIPQTRNGCLISVYGEGVLLVGESGIGKSDVALKLLNNNQHSLIADDLVEIRRLKNGIYGNACNESRNFMEARGLGIVNVKGAIGPSAVKEVERIDLIINLVEPKDGENDGFDRIGEKRYTAEILDIGIPYMEVVVSSGRDLADIIKLAALDNRRRIFGFDSTKELFKTLGMAADSEDKPIMVKLDKIWGS